jgi:hypothetical protein
MTEPGPGSDEGSDEGRQSAWERWYPVATTFVAPATFLTGVLFYYGYVSSRAQFRYFGVDVDTVGLSTRDYVMRSPQALLVPLLLVPIVGAALLMVSRLLDRRLPATAVPTVARGGAVLLGIGLAMLAAYGWLGSWPYYPMVTPMVLAAGLLALLWSWHRTGGHRNAIVLGLLALAVCVFWATATLAEWTGEGAARRTARHLDRLPSVVVDTPEQLHLGMAPESGVIESVLPEPGQDEEQEYRYRYRGLRLLIHAGDRMFLVPEHWTPTGSTVLVPLDDVRVRFRFVNDPP